MKNFTKKLRAYLNNNNLTQVELADKLGMSTASLNMYLKEHRTPSAESVIKIEETLGLPDGYLMYDKYLPLEKIVRLPLLEKKDIDNFLKKGILPDDVIYLPVFIDSKREHVMSKKCFFIKAEGDAMSSNLIPANSINNGDCVAVDPELKPDHDSTVLIRTDSDVKLRKLINDGADRYFSANNKDLSVIPESQAKIIGKVYMKQTYID